MKRKPTKKKTAKEATAEVMRLFDALMAAIKEMHNAPAEARRSRSLQPDVRGEVSDG